MSMVRALRTLNSIENGDLTGSQYETILTGSAARVGELRVLLGIASQYKRIAASPTTCLAIGASATAMNQLLSLPTPTTYILADNTATSNLVADSQGAAKVLAYLAGLDYANYTSMDAALLSLDLNTAITNTPAVTAAFNLSTVAVGKKIAKDSGLTSSSYADVQALAANAGAMATVVGSSAGRTTMLISPLGMNKMLDSATALSAIEGNSPTMTALYALEMASVKYAAKKTGTVDYYDYTTAAQMAASADFATASASTAAARAAVGNITNTTVSTTLAGSNAFFNTAITSQELMTSLGGSTVHSSNIVNSATAMTSVLSQGTAIRGFTSTTTGATAFYSSSNFLTSRGGAYVFGLYPIVSTAFTTTSFSGLFSATGGTGTAITTSNGLPAIRGLVATSNHLGTAANLGVSEATYAITAVVTTYSASTIILLGKNVSADAFNTIRFSSSNSTVAVVGSAGSEQISPTLSPAIPSNGTTWVVLQIGMNSASSFARVNNGTAQTIAVSSAPNLNAFTHIGCRDFGVATSDRLGIAELIIHNDVTDTAGLDRVRNALGAKYGLF